MAALSGRFRLWIFFGYGVLFEPGCRGRSFDMLFEFHKLESL
jgi:hypothetical protein